MRIVDDGDVNREYILEIGEKKKIQHENARQEDRLARSPL